MKCVKRTIVLFAAVFAAAAVAQAQSASPSLGPNYNGARYATDAYPGFDSEDEIVKPERREPKWFSFITGPKKDSAAEQMAYCQELVADGSFSKAAKELDNLVRNWPTAPEAAKAQEQLADIQSRELKDYEDAFKSYRYLLDFYSLQCDYQAIADKMYQLAGVLRIEGKEVMFVRFENLVDVRRAYETCVLRAPGAKWVPAAMLTIADLRVKDGQKGEAIKVYENLRNIHPDSDEAKVALVREAAVRMELLNEHAYNRFRCQDTIGFMKMALRTCRPEDAEAIQGYLTSAQELIAEEAWRATKFYDSTTRTKRSAVRAYERFLADYPLSAHADEARARLGELKGESE